jgi:hypothetical protein
MKLLRKNFEPKGAGELKLVAEECARPRARARCCSRKPAVISTTLPPPHRAAAAAAAAAATAALPACAPPAAVAPHPPPPGASQSRTHALAAEDMWHVFNLVRAGDRLTGTTFRKVVKDGAAASESERVRLKLTLAVESVDFDPEGASGPLFCVWVRGGGGRQRLRPRRPVAGGGQPPSVPPLLRTGILRAHVPGASHPRAPF